jgi:organic radical activating enzyme
MQNMSKFDPNKLLISEMFYSVQGEGPSTGIPAVFIRLTHCDLSCGVSRKKMNELIKDDTIQPNTRIESDLPDATWVCDSIPVWKQGKQWEFSEVIGYFKNNNIYDDICLGNIHIVWTGGEPTIKQHQESIYNFYSFISQCLINPYMEIETNGRNYIEQKLFLVLNQINCSPKLSNSGMTEKQRIVPESIQRIMQHRNYNFKFVVSNENDIEEAFVSYIYRFNIPIKNVLFMPGMDKQEQYFERTNWILEMAKKYKFRALSRLHIASWGDVTGV